MGCRGCGSSHFSGELVQQRHERVWGALHFIRPCAHGHHPAVGDTGDLGVHAADVPAQYAEFPLQKETFAGADAFTARRLMPAPVRDRR